MKIISCNVNGIRSAVKKGLIEFIDREQPDILCLQEIKAMPEDFPDDINNLKNYHLYINPAVKKGYSGVAVFTRTKPVSVNYKFSFERFDNEGRLLELQFPDFTLFNLYLPHGGRDKENLGYKLEVYAELFHQLNRFENANVILAGDFNIAHTEIDLARPKENFDNIMFTISERKQIDQLIDLGYVDSFRKFNQLSGNYTWWRYGYDARENNIGWRIDYAFVSLRLAESIKNVRIYPDVIFSDHCPIGLELD